MFRNHTGRTAAIITLISTAALPQTGQAASYLDTAPRGIKTSYSASLVDMTQSESGITTQTLDWRQPSVELYFDLPPSERTSEIILTLSADPLTRVAKHAPLEVQFNNGEPVPVLSNARGFEARIPFNVATSSSRRNLIRITYPTPSGSDCVSPEHGAWSIDLAQSSLRISGRTKTRNMSLKEVTDYLRQPALSPKTVGLVAHGPNGTDMQALAAQGVSLRTPGVPKFSVTPRNTDFNIIMVKRDRLSNFTDDPMILNSEGPRIFVPRGRPTKLIFTADTDKHILQMLDLFATRSLPRSSRPISSLGEMNLQFPLNSQTIKVEGKTRLLDLAVTSADPASGSQTYKFGVSDPAEMEGDLLLHLGTTKNLADNSRLRVTLNGKTLGAAKLDKKRKSVAFDIQLGALNATSNILTLTPDLESSPTFSCPTGNIADTGFSIRDNSRLNITQSTFSPVTELSQLTSTGGLFATSESYIALPRQTSDYQASLQILGRMAKAAGQGFTSADFTRNNDVRNDKHVLIVGPSHMAKQHLTGAPKALREALAGRAAKGTNLLQASYERAASIGSDEAMIQYAAAQSAPRRVTRGGIAALYTAGNGKLTGVISAAPGTSFTQASRALIQPKHWNALQGGVARWTSSTVVMAQTAQSDAGISRPKPQSGFEWPDLGISRLEDIDIQWPEIEWPEIELPEFEMPQVGFPTFKWSSFKASDNGYSMRPVSQEGSLSRATKLNGSKLSDIKPRLKPAAAAAASTTIGLRGPFEYSSEKTNRFSSLQDIRRETQVKWAETKRWSQVKTNRLLNKDTSGRLDGRSFSKKWTDKLPQARLVQIGGKSVSIYGLLLILAFGIVLLLMSLARPASRLSKR